MHSEKFRINTNGQSLRNPTNGFYGMTLSANNLNSDESDLSGNNDRRSAHNALERQRREHLNNKFQQLAHVLPALQSVRRPSKTMIVAKSLEFVTSSIERESTFASEIKRLREENAKLKIQAEKSKQQAKKVVDKEEQTSLKRKANTTDVQPSPPPTPEATPRNKVIPKKQVVIVGNPVHPKKKRMVKQTKSVIDPSTLTPWSPIDTVKSQHDPFTATHSTAPTHFDVSNSTENNSTTLFFTPNDTPYHYLQSQNNASFMPEMNPVLLAPYYIPSESDLDSFTSFTSQAPSHPPFYL